jgi:uncharacterized membrane protein
MCAQPQPQRPTPPELAQVVERNIESLLARRHAEERERGTDERIAHTISSFAGSMPFVYLHLALFGIWIAINLGLTPVRPFDPSFVILAMVASVEAIFISTFVLITQNRMAAMADKRADLDLQISLLAEHEITRLVELLTEVAERLGVESARNPELAELSRDVAPERVLDTMDAAAGRMERVDTGKRPRT